MLASWRNKTKLIPTMVPPLPNGLAGVSKGVEIPFWTYKRHCQFFTSLFSEGYQYQSLNAYRSAISFTHEKVDGVNVGSHPAVTRLLKGVFNSRPPQPRYLSFWNVGLVVQYLRRIGPNGEVTHK